MVKGKRQETQLILAVPPPTPQPGEFWARQELSMVQSQEATAPSSPTPSFAPLHTPENTERNTAVPAI